MPQQAFERTRTRQPQGATRVNWANPLSRGLTTLWAASTNTDHRAGAPASFNGGTGMTPGAGPAGIYRAFVAGSGKLTVAIPSDTVQCTLLFQVSSLVAVGGLGRILSTFNGAGGNDIYLDPGAIFLQEFFSVSNGNYTIIPVGTGLEPATVAIAMFGVAGVAPVAFVNGRQVTASVSSTGSGTRTAGGTVLGIGCRPDVTTRQLDSGRLYCVARHNRAASPVELALLSTNPWQLFAPRVFLIASSATVQLLRPVSDVSAGAWTPSSGLTLAPMINEAVAADASFITVSSASTSEVAFGTGLSPGVTTGHTIRFRAQGTGGLAVRLMQGATIISSFSPTLTTAYALYTWTLSGAEAAAISNYADLRLRFVST